MKLKEFLKETSDKKDVVKWENGNTSNTISFVYPPKEDSLTYKFVNTILKAPGITKKQFYSSINKELSPGHNSHFFAAINDSGIVELVGQRYYIGPNYGKWTQGKLKMKTYKDEQPKSKKPEWTAWQPGDG